MVFWRKKKKKTEDNAPAEEALATARPVAEETAAVAEDSAESNPAPAAEATEIPDVVTESVAEPVTEVVADPVIEVEEKPVEEAVEEIEPESEPELAPVPPTAPASVPVEDTDSSTDEKGAGWLSRLSSGLSKSSSKITQGLTDIVTKKKLDQAMLDELEEVLITADLGPSTAMDIVEAFGKDRFGKDISAEEIKEALADSMTAILAPVAKELSFEAPADGGPLTILVCGVNGAGKTTTIGKLAHELKHKSGKSVMIAAADTFRAAAIEQLQVWADRAGAALMKKDIGADSAAVAYESYEKAKAEGSDILFIDTAGRLHNKSNLMAELEKIVRVLKKKNENLPHAVLLVLDATTGQNAHEQVRIFGEMVDVTGLIVTKLDGSAKGGVVVGLADKFGLPIHMIGVGEQIGDLHSFAPDDFAKSLVGLISDRGL